MLKAAALDKFGCALYLVPIEVNEHGYVLVPENPDAIQYALYAPLKGFETQGPWYLLRCYSRREARAARFTVVGLNNDSDLIPCFPPDIQLPSPAEGQTHWLLYLGGVEVICGAPASMIANA